MVKEDWCAVTATAEIISTKWKPVIIDRLLDEPKRFNELRRIIPRISAKVLAENLADLETEGILKRDVDQRSPIKVHYRLTEKGQSLKPVMEAMERWGERWLTKEAKKTKGLANEDLLDSRI